MVTEIISFKHTSTMNVTRVYLSLVSDESQQRVATITVNSSATAMVKMQVEPAESLFGIQ